MSGLPTIGQLRFPKTGETDTLLYPLDFSSPGRLA